VVKIERCVLLFFTEFVRYGDVARVFKISTLHFLKYLNIAELTKVLVGGLILLIPFFFWDVIFYVCNGLYREFNCCEYERCTGECGV
jgi:Sec-independent protein secretion pathway component TatC